MPRFFENPQLFENDEPPRKVDAVEPSEVATTVLTQTTATTFTANDIEFEVESDSGQTHVLWPFRERRRRTKIPPGPSTQAVS